MRCRCLPVLMCLFCVTPVARAGGAPPGKPRLDGYGFPLPNGAVARMGSNHFRHPERVNAVALSADGSLLAVAGAEGAVALWDVKTGQKRRDLAGRDGVPVRSLAFSADGKTLAALLLPNLGLGGGGPPVARWDVATGTAGKRQEVKAPNVTAIAFAADGRLICTSRQGKRVEVRDAATGKALGPPLDHPADVQLVAFAADGRTLATASGFSNFHVWDVAEGKELARVRIDDQGVAATGALAVSNDRRRLAIYTYPFRFTIYDLPSGKRARQFEQTGVTALAFAGDGATVAAGTEHYAVRLYDAASGAEQHPAVGHVATMGAVAISADGRHVATAAYDRTVQLWDAASGKRLHHFDIRAWAHSIVFTPDGTGVVFAGRHGLAPTRTALADGKEVRTFAGSEDQHLHLLANSADGKRLLGYAFGNRTLYVWDHATGRLEEKITEEVAFRLWSLRLGLPLKRPQWHREAQVLVDVGPDGRRAIATEPVPDLRYNALALCDLATGRVQRRLDPPVAFWGEPPQHFARFAPDGRTIVCVNAPPAAEEQQVSAIRIYETATGKLRRRLRGPASGVVGLGDSADGRLLVTAGNQEPAMVWDLHGTEAPIQAPGPDRMQALWDRLAHGEADTMSALIAEWTAGGNDTVAFLRKHLPPAAALPDDARIARWVAELDHDDYDVRQGAVTELGRLGEHAEPALRKALAKPASLEARRRIEGLLAQLERDTALPAPDKLRAIRALEVLERLGLPSARELLAALANGEPRAWLTQDAAATLRRIERRAGQ